MSATPDTTLTPAGFLSRSSLVTPDNRPNPALNGSLCPAALRTFEQQGLAPQELETFVEALRQMLPAQETGTPAEKFEAATDGALDLLARLLNKEPNPVLERWAMEFVPFIESDAGAKAAVAHFQNILALYTVVMSLKHAD